jgi:hypothetical protein
MAKDIKKSLSAQALEAFRKAAGFRSASAAADHFGWPASLFRSHESGVRTITAKDAARYAEGLNIPPRHILDPSEAVLEDAMRRVGTLNHDRRHGAASRLRALRHLAGYASAAEFARDWDIVAGTYVKHEDGQNRLSEPVIQLYSRIFGIRAPWLATGLLPSGMGPDVDADIEAIVRNPEAAHGRRRLASPPDREKIARLRSLLTPGRPASSTFGLSEFDWDELEKAQGRPEKIMQAATWSVPASFFLGQDLDHEAIFVVAASHARDGLEVGERVFVHRNQAYSETAQFLFMKDRRIRFGLASSDANIIGTVIGRLRSTSLS